MNAADAKSFQSYIIREWTLIALGLEIPVSGLFRRCLSCEQCGAEILLAAGICQHGVNYIMSQDCDCDVRIDIDNVAGCRLPRFGGDVPRYTGAPW